MIRGPEDGDSLAPLNTRDRTAGDHLVQRVIESCECNVRWLRLVDANLSQPHMNMCGRPRICIRGW